VRANLSIDREWLDLDLRCYTCDSDLWLQDGTQFHCSMACSRTVALSAEIVHTFRLVLHHLGVRGYLDRVGCLPVADAMLEEHPQRRRASREEPSGLRSYQWRTLRLQQLETLIPA
jgi:hypothetical protein